jgi:hypothetical protein
MVAQKNMVSLAKLLRIRQGIEKKYKNMGLENFPLSINSKSRKRFLCLGCQNCKCGPGYN